MAVYIFYPKGSLKDVIAEFTNFGWEKTQVWLIPETSHKLPSQQEYFSNWAKVVFMINLSIYCRAFDDSVRFLETLFGNPIEYTITNFDKWWDIELVNGLDYYETLANVMKSSDLKEFTNVGDADIDKFIEGYRRYLMSKE